MSGVRVALDTSIAIRLLNGAPATVARFNAEGLVALPMAVVGELLYGAANSGLKAKNLSRYESFVMAAEQLPIDLETARRYADLRLALKHAGHPIPENDLWIAASCLRHRLVLVTGDGHFSVCPGVVTEDWTRPAT